MRVSALGDVASQMPWLSPCAASLLALARSPAASAWLQVRHDPGAVLLILRQTTRGHSAIPPSSIPKLIQESNVLDGARHFLHATDGLEDACFVDWSDAAARQVYDASITYARLAFCLSELSGKCQPDVAWVAGLLAPLGWQFAVTVMPDEANKCLNDPAFELDPAGTQVQYWNVEHSALIRRVLRQWGLPEWLTKVLSHLGLSADVAQSLGADPNLFRVVQLAIGLAQQGQQRLGLRVGGNAAELAASLGLTEQIRHKRVAELTANIASVPAGWQWTNPARQPLLGDVLDLAIDNRRLRLSGSLAELEHDRDELCRALEVQRSGEAERIQENKLKALAEFAAGAAHEINNPLAVISGQAQFLLSREIEPSEQRALQTIIGQTQRVHQVLKDLMQFARPPRLQCRSVDLREIVKEVVLTLTEMAMQKRVRLVCPEPAQPVSIMADPRHLGTAIECLLRNAIEAAPAGGWAGLRIASPTNAPLELVIEDSGPGPAAGAGDHLFDPFFSGKQAGRGRGLGLPRAWRLAREHGGDVRFEKVSGQPTRFVLSLPLRAPASTEAAPSSHYAHASTVSENGKPGKNGKQCVA